MYMFQFKNMVNFKFPNLKERGIYSIQDVKQYCAKDDPKNIVEWNVTTTQDYNFKVRYGLLPITTVKIRNQILDMIDSYDEFPKDRNRTNKIKKEMLNTGKLFPVFIEEKDNDLFILEGRHRIVAYYELDIITVPIFFVLS